MINKTYQDNAKRYAEMQAAKLGPAGSLLRCKASDPNISLFKGRLYTVAKVNGDVLWLQPKGLPDADPVLVGGCDAVRLLKHA
jgi:hypothetical protein